MNNYVISYEWDIVIVSVFTTVLLITLGYKLKLVISEWYFVYGRNKKYEFIKSIKFNIYTFFEWINVKCNLNLFIRENDFIDISSNYVHRVTFHLPDNQRIDKMKMHLIVSRSMDGINPLDRRQEKTIFLSLKKAQWDTIKYELDKFYSQVTNY